MFIYEEEARGIREAYEDFKNDSDYTEFRELTDEEVEVIVNDDIHLDIEELKEYFEDNLVLE